MTRIELGRSAHLSIVKFTRHGAYLDAGAEFGQVLLPNRYLDDELDVGDELEVFLYLDSEDTPIATTVLPYAQVGQCACLKVVDINAAGAFVDWGLDKDLLVPFGEQRVPMQIGRNYVVHLYLDNSGRIVASTKLNRFLKEENIDFQHPFKRGEQVNLLICSRSELGMKAVINGTHLGLLHRDEILQPLRIGKTLKGYIKNIRRDRRIDLSLQLQGQAVRDELGQRILTHLRACGGTSPLTDRSSPEDIYRQFQVSKGNYKKALGGLYKQQLIALESDCVRLLEQ